MTNGFFKVLGTDIKPVVFGIFADPEQVEQGLETVSQYSSSSSGGERRP